MNILVTGSSGLIGSEAVAYFDRQGHSVTGIDNNMRRVFFGEAGDTSWNLERLKRETRFTHLDVDIQDLKAVSSLFAEQTFDLVIHCAAQPSHDKAAEIPLTDFLVNAAGTVVLLEATRLHSPKATFIFMSTNKVYGDAPNEKEFSEGPTRYDYQWAHDKNGIDETCRIDQSLHSLFGASKLSADIYAQEYGKYFGLNVGIFRGGCVSGQHHSGVEQHGFLSHLIKTATAGETYTVYGYKGKQVRDNIHSFDVVRAFEEFAKNPRPGHVYNLGGGRENSISILEAIALVQKITGHEVNWKYSETPRKGDHMCYISDTRKFRSHYPTWEVTRNLQSMILEMKWTNHLEEARAV